MSDYISLANDLKRVVNAAPLVIFQVNSKGTFTLSDGGGLKILGLEPGQIVGLSVFDVYKDYPIITSSFKKILEDGKDVQFSVVINENVYFETKLTAIIQGGKILGANGVATDISEQKSLETELINSEERYRILVESAPFGILVMQNAVIQYANKKLVKIFGYENLSDVIGKPGIIFLSPKVREKLLKRALNREKGGEEPKSYESIGLKKSGEEFPMAVNMEQINYNGKPAVMGFYQDITEQKRTEKQNQFMIKQLIHTQKLESLGILAGGIAHDFNNLLVGIMGYASLISDKIDPESPIYEYISKIEKTSKLASDLTRQMLNYSGKGQFQKEVVSLKDLIEDYKNLLRSSVSKSNDLIFKLEDNLPLIEVDTTQIRQVIINLVTNASEAIDHHYGIITISLTKVFLEKDEDFITFHAPLNPGTYLVLEVEDNGKGIESDNFEKIYDPFFTTKVTGRGLGLAVVHGIVMGHHGTIKVTSEIGKGTSFRVFLPVKEGLKIETSTPLPKLKKETKKGTILICDDEEIVADVASKMLQELNYKIIFAKDGNESISKYIDNQNKIDLVLLDLTMPKLSGEEVFVKIREIDPQAKIILSSGYSKKEAMLKFSGMNLSGFIQKPYRFQDLVRIVNELVQE